LAQERIEEDVALIMFAAALLVFFASGFAALVYQVIWQRLLTIFLGADVQSATLVVAAFMTGLGCGSLVGGQVADRVSRTCSVLCWAATTRSRWIGQRSWRG
jgi:fucose permease